MSGTREQTQHILTGPLEQARGVIGRYPDPDEEYVFEFNTTSLRCIHMIGVRGPLEVEWWADGDLIQRKVLHPWVGFGAAKADRIIERRPGTE